MNFQIPKWLVPTLGILLAIFVALLIIDHGYNIVQMFQNKNPKNTITISGEGKVSATPDLATISVGVINQAATPQAVQDATNKSINKIVDAVTADGVSKADITTSQFNLYPQHDYTNGKDTINGYQSNQTLTIKVHGVDKSTDLLTKVLADATSNGSNQIEGVSLTFDKPDDLREQARELAITSAKQKAQDLAKAAGITLGRVVNVSESGVGAPIPYPMNTAYGMGGGGTAIAPSVAPTVQTGSQDIIEDMSVTFEVK